MVGKRVRGALYVHASAIAELPGQAQGLIRQALEVAGDVAWNVARIEPGAVGLLLYREFERDPFPELEASTRVDLVKKTAIRRNYSGSSNPLILHRKEQLMPSAHPKADRWGALTAELEALGVFHTPHLIGRRKAWSERLATAGVVIKESSQ